MPEEERKVPLNVGWLAEEGLLDEATKAVGYSLVPGSWSKSGVMALEMDGGKPTELQWGFDLMFTVAQLLELGFMPGEFKYCPDCKRLQVDCELNACLAHMAEELHD